MPTTFQPQRIVEIRRVLGLSRAEFARKLNVTRQLVWAWERGRHVPTLEILARLADMTGAKLDSFLGSAAAARPTQTRRRRWIVGKAPRGTTTA
jgi:transcriptional regulator with XRE-family HTH domain